MYPSSHTSWILGFQSLAPFCQKALRSQVCSFVSFSLFPQLSVGLIKDLATVGGCGHDEKWMGDTLSQSQPYGRAEYKNRPHHSFPSDISGSAPEP